MSSGLRSMAHRVAGTIRTAGRIEFVRDQGPVRRNIRVNGFEWDPEVHRNLSKILWAAERSHNYAMAALRLFSKMPSSKFSPDGLLGGVGYIQQVKEMREGLGKAAEVLSAFCDTIDDEVNAEHWKAVHDGDPVTQDIIQSAQDVRQNPEQDIQQQFQEDNPLAVESGEAIYPEDMNPSPDDFNPFLQSDDEDGGDDEDGDDWGGSRLSSDNSKEVPLPGPKSALPTDTSEQKEGLTEVDYAMNTTGQVGSLYAEAIRQVLKKNGPKVMTAARRVADSSVDPAQLPGPRVMHVGPGASPEEFGYDTDWWDRPSDDPLGEGFRSLEPIYEDGLQDGVTGYSDPTDGDSTVFKSAARIAQEAATYSWLPGSRNEKPMSYERGLTEAEMNWLRANDAPDPPADWVKKQDTHIGPDPMWESLWEQDGLSSSV